MDDSPELSFRSRMLLWINSSWKLIKNNDLDLFVHKYKTSQVNTEIKNSLGETLFLFAVQHNRPEFVDYLLSIDADPFAIDNHGNDAIHYAIKYPELLTKLFEHTNFPQRVNNARRTPLHCAIEHNYVESIIILMRNGADPNTVDLFGRSPYQTLMLSGSRLLSDRIQIFTQIQPKLRIEITYENGSSPLSIAFEKRSVTIATMMISARASLRSEANIKYVLGLACEVDNSDIIRYYHTTHRGLFDKYINDIMNTAISSGSRQIILYLVTHGIKFDVDLYLHNAKKSIDHSLLIAIYNLQKISRVYISNGRACSICCQIDDGRDKSRQLLVFVPCGHTCCRECIVRLPKSRCHTCSKGIIEAIEIVFSERESSSDDDDGLVNEFGFETH